MKWGLLENEYATKDLYLAAFFYIKGLQIKKLEKYGDQKPVYFIFDDKAECIRLENMFWNGEGDEVIINVKEYTMALRNLRTRVFSVAMMTKRAGGNIDQADQ